MNSLFAKQNRRHVFLLLACASVLMLFVLWKCFFLYLDSPSRVVNEIGQMDESDIELSFHNNNLSFSKIFYHPERFVDEVYIRFSRKDINADIKHIYLTALTRLNTLNLNKMLHVLMERSCLDENDIKRYLCSQYAIRTEEDFTSLSLGFDVPYCDNEPLKHHSIVSYDHYVDICKIVAGQDDDVAFPIYYYEKSEFVSMVLYADRYYDYSIRVLNDSSISDFQKAPSIFSTLNGCSLKKKEAYLSLIKSKIASGHLQLYTAYIINDNYFL